MRLDVQQARVHELLEQVAFWRSKATAAESKADATELALQRAQRLQSQAEMEARDLRKQAAAAQEAASLAQRSAADLEQRVWSPAVRVGFHRSCAHAHAVRGRGGGGLRGRQLADLRQRLDEDADDLTTATRARRQLESDLADMRALMAKEVQGRERLLGEVRQELLKVTHQSTVDLESERNAAALLRTNVKVRRERGEPGREERARAEGARTGREKTATAAGPAHSSALSPQPLAQPIPRL